MENNGGKLKMKLNKWSLFILMISALCIVGAISVANTGPVFYKVQFKNNTKIEATYYMYQIDHGLTQYKKPLAFVVGTLKPKQSWTVKREAGMYYVEWKHNNKTLTKTEPFHLDESVVFELTQVGETYTARR